MVFTTLSALVAAALAVSASPITFASVNASDSVLEVHIGGRSSCSKTYTVVSGDTCVAIESKTGVSDAQLHSLNPSINSGCTNLQIAQVLCLSSDGSGSCSKTYTVVSGDICGAIESKTGVSDAQLHALNPSINSACTNLQIDQTLCVGDSGTGNSSGKRGLCWPYYNGQLDPGRLNDGKGHVSLIYDYETYAPRPNNGNGGLNFIGMQRCLDCDSSPISQLQARQQQLGFSTVFTLNEPDINGISPQSAAQWYIQNINPLRIKKALPAVTSSTAPGQGLDWLRQMIAACAGQCFFDYINIHWYGPNFAQFQAFVNQAHSQFPNNQIIITEFALQNPPGGQGDQVNFFKQAFPFLDAAAFVQMYFPFVATTPSLFSANDPAGAAFVGVGSTLFNNDGNPSAVGQLMFS